MTEDDYKKGEDRSKPDFPSYLDKGRLLEEMKLYQKAIYTGLTIDEVSRLEKAALDASS